MNITCAFLPEEKHANVVKFSEFSYLVHKNDRFYIIFAVMDGLYCFFMDFINCRDDEENCFIGILFHTHDF